MRVYCYLCLGKRTMIHNCQDNCNCERSHIRRYVRQQGQMPKFPDCVKLSEKDDKAMGGPSHFISCLVRSVGITITQNVDGCFDITTHFPDGCEFEILDVRFPRGKGVFEQWLKDNHLAKHQKHIFVK